MSSVFFIKLRAVYYRVATLLRSWSTIDFFLKILFFKTASFRYIFQKVSVMSYLNSKVAVWTLQVCNFTERNSFIDVFLRNLQIFAINYFRNIFISVEEAYYTEKLLESWALGHGKVAAPPLFCTEYSLISNIC